MDCRLRSPVRLCSPTRRWRRVCIHLNQIKQTLWRDKSENTDSDRSHKEMRSEILYINKDHIISCNLQTAFLCPGSEKASVQVQRRGHSMNEAIVGSSVIQSRSPWGQ
ncbi:hypothetical protein DAI22_08g232000 [Oryza sativa Japonica Group]|nr:hypothetical protein DAI22_08g232000 [Oryza sativa Japonica Group]